MGAQGPALTFGVAAGDRVSTSVALGLGTAYTYALWVRPTSLVNASALINQPLTTGVKRTELSGTGGNVIIRNGRATTAMVYTTTGTPLVTTNKWYFVASVVNLAGSAGALAALYVGDLVVPPVAVAISASDGSGTGNAESGVAQIGNSVAANTPWNGQIAWVGAWDVVLSAFDIGRIWENAWNRLPTRLDAFLGATGSNSVLDLSGKANHGIVTSAPQGTSQCQAHLEPQIAVSKRPFSAELLA